MNEAGVESPESSASDTYLLVPILLLFLLLIIAVLRSPNLVSSAGIGSAVIVMTPLVLATYALMSLAIAGRGTVDLSVGPLMGFINVTLVQLHGAGLLESPLVFFLYAIGVGIAYQLLMGLIIVYVRVQPIIVALSGYLALSGMNLVILPRPGGSAPEWMSAWGLGTTIFSPVLVILVLCTASWLLFTRTAFYGHLRLMGFGRARCLHQRRAHHHRAPGCSLHRRCVHRDGGLELHRADWLRRPDAGHHLHLDRCHRAGAGRHQPSRRARRRDRLAAGCGEPVPDRLCARDLQLSARCRASSPIWPMA